ncbi:MAG: Synechococcus phage [Bacteroidota bacterium]
MKKLFTLFFLISVFVANAQESFFKSNNNYVAPPLAPFQAPPIVTNGLLLNLDAANPASYSGTGNTWNDISTQNNHATFVGSPTFSSNPASFTFGSNVIATTTKSNIAFAEATFIAWVNPSQTQGSYTGIIFSRSGFGGSTVPATGLDLYTNNSIGYHWADNGSTYNWNSNLFVPNNAWSMIAITISANTATAYLCNVNGIITAVNSVSHAALSGFNFFIACDPSDQSSRAFKGKIATAMIYNTKLTLSDITSTFNLQKSRFGL